VQSEPISLFYEVGQIRTKGRFTAGEGEFLSPGISEKTEDSPCP
jgi:phage terminase large subunit-like protein